MAVDNDWTIAGEFSDENFSAYSAYSGPGLESAKTSAIQAAKDTGQIAMLIAQATTASLEALATPPALRSRSERSGTNCGA